VNCNLDSFLLLGRIILDILVFVIEGGFAESDKDVECVELDTEREQLAEKRGKLSFLMEN
jgi:hypothetical protein